MNRNCPMEASVHPMSTVIPSQGMAASEKTMAAKGTENGNRYKIDTSTGMEQSDANKSP
ncbi:MAG: hypothetical protein IPK83_14510 [Planctomycetes bacterium]|nr:hypothetical protein [Planctomycetota bacterium]